MGLRTARALDCVVGRFADDHFAWDDNHTRVAKLCIYRRLAGIWRDASYWRARAEWFSEA